MEREKGFESGGSPVVSGPHAAVVVTGQGPTRPTEASHRPDADALPSEVPSFLEACGQLASRAAALGEYAQAREIIFKAAQVASSFPTTPRDAPRRKRGGDN